MTSQRKRPVAQTPNPTLSFATVVGEQRPHGSALPSAVSGEIAIIENRERGEFTDLPICGAIRLDDPSSLSAHGLQDLVVVTVLGELVVAVHPKPGEDLRGDRAPPPLPPLVVLPLLPRRQPRPRWHLRCPRSGLEIPDPGESNVYIPPPAVDPATTRGIGWETVFGNGKRVVAGGNLW